MINGKKVLAYIPIRSGSKGLPNKNILDFSGKPLVAWTIEAAKKSKYVDEIIVSTDSLEYAEVCKQWGASVPFIRPDELASDTAKEIDAALHLIEYLESQGNPFDYILKLQATSPLRDETDIDKAIELLHAKNANGIISVSKSEHNPLWMNTLDSNHTMDHFLKQEAIQNRQSLPIYYELDGLVFAARWEHIKNAKSWYGQNTFASITESGKNVDIDSEIDLEFARVLIKKRLGVSNGPFN